MDVQIPSVINSSCEFQDWGDNGGNISSAWRFGYEALEYNHGQITKLIDADSVALEIFYGDNANNLSNTANRT